MIQADELAAIAARKAYERLEEGRFTNERYNPRAAVAYNNAARILLYFGKSTLTMTTIGHYYEFWE